MKKTYPKFSDFLAGELHADPTTISNVVRFCREFSQKGKQKRGGGSAEVTPVFAARVLLALTGGGAVPGRAAIMLEQLVALTPTAAWLPDMDGLPPGWCEGYLDDVLARLIKARMKDENFDQHIWVDVARFEIPGATMVLKSPSSEFRCRFGLDMKGGEREPVGGGPRSDFGFGITESARLQADTWQAVADWLAGRTAE